MPAAYADIMTGETNVADISFLVAVILVVIAAVLYVQARPERPGLAAALVAVALGLVAFGLMAL